MCGSQNPDVGSFCYNCGKPLTQVMVSPSGAAVAPAPRVAPTHQPATQPGAAAPADLPAADPELLRIRSEHPELVGVGGWLGWFSIVIGVLSPLFILGGIISEPSVYSVFDLALGAFSIYTAVLIWRVSPRALRMTKILLILEFCIAALLLVAQLSDTSSKSDPAATRMLFGSIVWFSYFKKSRRVKATFGRSI